MPKSKFGKSRAERVSESWKEIAKLRRSYPFPEFKHPSEVNDNWHVSAGMPHDALRSLRHHADIVYDGMGYMPWSQLPRE